MCRYIIDIMNDLPAQPNQSILDGFRLLKSIAQSGEPLGVRELGRLIEMEPTRVYRLLRTMLHLRIIRQTDRKKYVAGPGLHILSVLNLSATGLLAGSVGALERLKELGYTTAMGFLWQDQVGYLYHGSPETGKEQSLLRKTLFPATKSGIGLALLALEEDPYIRTLYGSTEIPGFPEGINSLMAELNRVRALGYAYIVIDASPFLASLGVALENFPDAGIALSGKIHPEDIPGLVERLMKTAAEIDRRP